MFTLANSTLGESNEKYFRQASTTLQVLLLVVVYTYC